MITSERTIKGKARALDGLFYISSLTPDALRMNHAVRQHWRVENSLRRGMEVVFGDDQMRTCTNHAAHNLAVLRRFVLNLLRLAPARRKGGLKTQQIIAATSDSFRAELLGLV